MLLCLRMQSEREIKNKAAKQCQIDISTLIKTHKNLTVWKKVCEGRTFISCIHD